MATLDEILGGGSAKDTGENAPVPSPVATGAETPGSGDRTEEAVPAGGYEMLFRKLNPYSPKTPEQIAGEEKRHRRKQIFNAIGDGISALSNLFFTSRGAPDAHDRRNSLTARSQVRYDRLVKEREGRERAYYEGLARARMADVEDAVRERGWKRQLGIDKMNADKIAAELERKRALAEAQQGRYKALQDKDVAMTAYYEAKTDALISGVPLEEALILAKIAKEKAVADRNNRQGTPQWHGGSGGSGGGYSLFNPNTGKTESFRNKTAWESRFSELYGEVAPGQSTTVIKKDVMGNGTTTTQRGSSVASRIGQRQAKAKKEWEKKNGQNNNSKPAVSGSHEDKTMRKSKTQL
ncbi:MAG: hypothetical protein SPF56_08875 [Bacteroidaceae bacterium]|nr:hypothetical protein [Bacteroidaceae bacterium]